MAHRQLFPTLPAELRNSIYFYASTPSQNPATTTSLPFTTKQWDSSHTKITICPVHYGNQSLLILRRYHFQEAEEYHSWIKTQGVELRIAVEFKGHVDTFLQKHWDEKVATHMRKLIKKGPWVSKVVRWDVRVLWDPPISSLQRAKAGIAGRIVNNMVDTLLEFQDEDVRRMKGDVRVRFVIPYRLAYYKIWRRMEYGLETFLSGNMSTTAKAQVREVILGTRIKERLQNPVQMLMAVPDVLKGGGDLLMVWGNDRVQWSVAVSGDLVMRRVVDGREKWRGVLIKDRMPQGVAENALQALKNECKGGEELRLVDV